MITWLRKVLYKPILHISDRYSSKPDKENVFEALTNLLRGILEGDKKKGLVVPFEVETGKFIILSDMHKGRRNGADDFAICEPNYLAALDYYYQNGYHLIILGDCEELWENTLASIKKAQQPSYDREKKFISGNAFIKIFGNHDLYWQNDPFAPMMLKEIYEADVSIYEGVVLQTKIGAQPLHIFCTHGHQGDKVSDGNWFSKFFISKIWAPLQAFLKINPNTPAYDTQLKTLHNSMMYQWSEAQKDLILITGHTHQPVFESLTHIERLYRQLQFARQIKDKDMCVTLENDLGKRKFTFNAITEDYLKLKPTYFNSGCCCFNDGDITGLEISEGVLRLVEWSGKHGSSERIILEETPLNELLAELNKANNLVKVTTA